MFWKTDILTIISFIYDEVFSNYVFKKAYPTDNYSLKVMS